MTPENTPHVDCVTFGSPCQDLSIAGKREGLVGARSGLFMDAVRIIKNMQLYSFGAYPKFAVWENVPGAFSSNKGEDFRAVLEELARIKEPEVSIPRPDGGKWAKAGFISGNGWSIAWRTLDAQFWGVPQRRRRIALVMDFGGQRAGEILFERTGLSGYLEPSIPPWKGIARNPAHRSAGYDRTVENAGECLTPWDVQSRRIYEASGKWPSIYSGEGGGHGYVMLKDCTAYPDTARALTARHDGSPCVDRGPNVVCIQGNMIDRDVQQNGSGIAESETMFTPNATDRHGVCCAAFTAGQGEKANGIGYAEEQAPTLRTDGGLSAMPTILCRAQANTKAETYENLSPTLTACHDGPPIVFESHSQDARYTQQGDTAPACTAQWGTGGNNMPLAAFTQNQRDEVRDLREVAGALAAEFGMKQQTYIAQAALTPWDNQARRVYSEDGSFPALSAREHAGQNQQTVLHKTPIRWIIRRLTPTECERLQGFPDGWTDIGEWIDSKGKRHKPADSPRYKALGNSIALPQWWWITCKMAQYLPEHATLGSLFDGIGGFPLVWETYHGKGTAVWASEIEEFPIAVTKKRFERLCR